MTREEQETYMENLMQEKAENYCKNIEKLFKKALKNCVYNPDIHEIAYENNYEYKIFYDKLSYEVKIEAQKIRKKLRNFLVIDRFFKAPFYLISLLIKSPKRIVNSKDFTDTFKLLNEILNNYQSSEEE